MLVATHQAQSAEQHPLAPDRIGDHPRGQHHQRHAEHVGGHGVLNKRIGRREMCRDLGRAGV
jgi:hypothetical protein